MHAHRLADGPKLITRPVKSSASGVPLLEPGALLSLPTLEKVVPNLVQLSDCRLEWRHKKLLALSSH